MALFNDGPISTAVDLTGIRNSVLSDASAEGINLAAKIMLAQQDVGNELMLFLARRARFRDYPGMWRALRAHRRGGDRSVAEVACS